MCLVVEIVKLGLFNMEADGMVCDDWSVYPCSLREKVCENWLFLQVTGCEEV